VADFVCDLPARWLTEWRHMQRITEILAQIKGVPLIVGVALVILSLIGHAIPGLSFLAQGDLLLHLGVIIGLGGLLFIDTL
jgi:hypothetical protein